MRCQTSPYLDTLKKVDFELEMAFITTDANKLGEPINVDRSRRFYFWNGYAQ